MKLNSYDFNNAYILTNKSYKILIVETLVNELLLLKFNGVTEGWQIGSLRC